MSGGLTVGGAASALSIDTNYADPGGGSLTVDGTLTTSSDVHVGGNLVAAATLTEVGLSNTGTLDIYGGDSGQAEVDVTGGLALDGLERRRQSEWGRPAGILRQ